VPEAPAAKARCCLVTIGELILAADALLTHAAEASLLAIPAQATAAHTELAKMAPPVARYALLGEVAIPHGIATHLAVFNHQIPFHTQIVLLLRWGLCTISTTLQKAVHGGGVSSQGGEKTHHTCLSILAQSLLNQPMQGTMILQHPHLCIARCC
jgi:hypothetical protein